MALAAAVAVTTTVLFVASPQVAFVVAAAAGVAATVYLYPAAAAYLIVGVTPLIAGIDRGLVIPVLRPNEALAVLVAVALLARSVPRWVVAGLPEIRLRTIDLTILLMAFTSSVLPLLWLAIRGKTATHDDLFYALVIWKYYGVFLIVRASVRTVREIRRCLAVGMVSAGVVAVIAILQALQLFGVPQLLASYYTHFGNVRALHINRGSSTLSLPVAVADLMVLNIAVTWAWLHRGTRHPVALYAATTLFVFGALAAGQFSGAIALVLCGAAIVLLARNVRPIITSVPIIVAAGIALRPVIERRLSGFASPQGLPESWVGRLQHLHTYFFPELFSRFHFVLGVQPAARVLLSERLGYVWIESGYTWLLWAGGIPLLGSFLIFLWTSMRDTARLARRHMDAVGIAATGAFVGLIVVGVLMVFDPHLTYRGSGDMLFALLALAAVGARVKSPATRPKDLSYGSTLERMP